MTLRLDDDYARIGFGPATVTFHKREADHHPKMHSAPNPDLPRLYYVDPDVAPEVVDSGQCYLLVIVAVLIVAFAYSRPTERGDS